jgi:hypothetical protein
MNTGSYKYLNYKSLALTLILAFIVLFTFSSETNAQIIRGRIGIGIRVREPAHVRVEHVPHNYISVYVGPRRYYYDEGAWYMRGRAGYTVVAAPVGARIKALPAGYVTLQFGGTNYYCYNGVYYTYIPDQETYVVVEKPVGAETTSDMKYDEVKLYDGSIVEGVFQGATVNSVTIKVGDQNREINISDIKSITFAPTISDDQSPK